MTSITHGVPLRDVGGRRAHPAARVTKAVFDIVLAGAALLILLPAIAAIAILVSLDGGPIIFSQMRIGRSGRRFRCLKFRTMAVDSDRILHHLLSTNRQAAAEWAATQKLRDDPRVTPLGRLLRRTSFDELPQLINVLRREMSLVGPRPIIDAEGVRYGDRLRLYCEARPGLTGLWQVSGRSTTSYAQRVDLDAWYVNNWSLWLDVLIIGRTVPALLKRQGAH